MAKKLTQQEAMKAFLRGDYAMSYDGRVATNGVVLWAERRIIAEKLSEGRIRTREYPDVWRAGRVRVFMEIVARV